MGPRFKDDPARAELLALYREADGILARFSCEDSTDCCRFGRTGREPYPTAVEIAEIEHAVRGAGGASAFAGTSRAAASAANAPGGASRARGGKLPVVRDERRCPFLSGEGRCRIYASRPLGCRTFYCERATSSDGQKLPRAQLQAVGKRVADLSQRAFTRDPGPRPLVGAFERVVRGETVLVDRSAR